MSFKATFALLGIVVALQACKGKSASDSADAGPKPVTADELNIDFTGAAEANASDKIRGANLGLTLEELAARWNAVAPKYKGSIQVGEWKKTQAPELQWSTAEADLAPGIQVGGTMQGKSLLHEVEVYVKGYPLAAKGQLLALWDTLLEAVSSEYSNPAKRRAVYEGLGLLAKPGKKRNELIDGDRTIEIVSDTFGSDKSDQNILRLVVKPVVPKPTSDKPFAIEFPMVNAPGFGKTRSFAIEYEPASRGKTFQEAADQCRTKGLWLCTEPLWQAACSAIPEIASIETWTASFTADYQKLQIRGGGDGCESGGGSFSHESKPQRAALCCSRSIPFSNDQNGLGISLSWTLLQYEQGLNLRNREIVERSLADTLATFYTQSIVPKTTAVQSSMSYLMSKPKAWSAHDSCEVTELLYDKSLFFTCRHNAFDGDKALVTESKYAYDMKTNGINWIQDSRILRRNSAF